MSDTFAVRHRYQISQLPAWLGQRQYDLSTHNANQPTPGFPRISLFYRGEPVGEIVCFRPAVFPDALIEVLHRQSAEVAA